MAKRNYQEISVIAQERRARAIPKEFLLPPEKLRELPKNLTAVPRNCGAFNAKELEIIESDAGATLQKLRERIWSAVEVTDAFCKAAVVAQQLTNCLTEILFDEARERARQLDQHIAATNKTVGPLHGLPISLKDCFQTPPHVSSIGMAFYADVETVDESLIVTMLRNLGAIPYVKTNVPVAMMMMETNNNIFGETINPHHRYLSAGGSSGGEAALISMYGSPLGVGTDIGGSIRIPSAFCGLYGLRPSFGRFPSYGMRSGIPGQEFIPSVNGPMSRTLEDLVVYSAALLSSSPAASPWTMDPKCIPLAWRSESQIHPRGRKLRLAIIGRDDSFVTAHPPVERALNVTRASLEANGHEVLDWPATDHKAMLDVLLAAFFGFGGTAILPQLDICNEPLFKSMSGYDKARSIPPLTADQIREMCISRNKLAKSYTDRWHATAQPDAGKSAIDGIIMAASPWAAVRAGFTDADPNNKYFGYTSWVNLIDLPACTFPVTKVDAAIDVKRTSFKALSELDEIVQADYDPKFYDGAPVALQLIGERLQEEKVLEVVGIIRDALRQHGGDS